jgi:ABC-2 type transport system permease protein
MSTVSNENSVPRSTTPVSRSRPFYWSVKRELWENRALYIAPLTVSGLILFGFVLSLVGLAERARSFSALPPAKQAAQIAQPYDIAAVAIIVTAFIVGFFYCLGALYGERRDRTILFWKSLPVSDSTTVLSKMSIPLVVLPLITFVVVVVLQVLMLLLNSAGRLVDGLSLAPLWTQLPLFEMQAVLGYGLVTLSLWNAPIFAWLLMVSAWARRTPILWAILPPLAVSLVEKIAFGTNYFGALIAHRLVGGYEAGFSGPESVVKAHGAARLSGGIPSAGLAQVDPIKFLTSPSVWIGLGLAAAFLAAAVWLRRYREPI